LIILFRKLRQRGNSQRTFNANELRTKTHAADHANSEYVWCVG